MNDSHRFNLKKNLFGLLGLVKFLSKKNKSDHPRPSIINLAPVSAPAIEQTQGELVELAGDTHMCREVGQPISHIDPPHSQNWDAS